MANQNLNESMNKAAKWSANMMIDRKSGIPVDSNSIKTSLDALKTYATDSDDVSYPGEIVSVVSTENSNATPNNSEFGAYIIDGEGNPHKLGFDDNSGNIEKGRNERAVQQIADPGKVAINTDLGEETPHFTFVGFDGKSVRVEYGATGVSSATFNSRNSASGPNSFAINNRTVASGDESFSQGYQSESRGNSSVATGSQTLAVGTGSHTEGLKTYASGTGAHAEGSGTKSKGNCSHTEGTNTTAGSNFTIATIIKKTEWPAGTVYVVDSDIPFTINSSNPGTIYKVNELTNNIIVSTRTVSGSNDLQPNEFGTHKNGSDYDFNEGDKVLLVEGTVILPYDHNVILSMDGDNAHAEGYGTIAVGSFSHSEGYETTTIGKNSHAEGQSTTTIGMNSHAEGYGTTSRGNCSHTEGTNTTTGNNSFIIRTINRMREYDAIKVYQLDNDIPFVINNDNPVVIYKIDNESNDIITSTKTFPWFESHFLKNEFGTRKGSTDYDFVEGDKVLLVEGDITVSYDDIIASNGENAHAEGCNTTAMGQNSHAEGSGTKSIGNSSHAEGSGTTSKGENSHTEGYQTRANNQNSHAEGESTTAAGKNSHTEGSNTRAYDENSHAEGESTTADGKNSHTEGQSTTTIGMNSHAEGQRTTAYGKNSHTEGYFTRAEGEKSHAEGSETRAIGNSSHAEGSGTTSKGENSHAEGSGTRAMGQNSHAEGIHTIAGNIIRTITKKTEWPAGIVYVVDSDIPFTINSNNLATIYKINESTNNIITSTRTVSGSNDLQPNEFGTHKNGSDYDFNEGDKVLIVEGDITLFHYNGLGENTHAEGYETKAIAQNSHAEGESTTTIGKNSHAEGQSTTTIGMNSHAEGYETEAKGNNSHTEGTNTTTER